MLIHIEYTDFLVKNHCNICYVSQSWWSTGGIILSWLICFCKQQNKTYFHSITVFLKNSKFNSKFWLKQCQHNWHLIVHCEQGQSPQQTRKKSVMTSVDIQVCAMCFNCFLAKISTEAYASLVFTATESQEGFNGRKVN